VGTSGFAFDGWRGPFYPADLKAKDMLSFYASRFRSVEINYTFRQHPSESTIAGWIKATPESFLFTLKAHQRITHVMKLAGEAGEAAKSFIARGDKLGSRLGPILFQCPPYLRFDRDRLDAFLGALPGGGRYVFEFRHASWAEGKAMIAERGATWCLTETDEEPVADDAVIEPSRFAYLRLRKTDYSPVELAAWAARIRPALDRGQDVFCYFKHEDEGIGPRLAGELTALMG
jgi:uncharacterized protein YecE (DUF72 family)